MFIGWLIAGFLLGLFINVGGLTKKFLSTIMHLEQYQQNLNSSLEIITSDDITTLDLRLAMCGQILGNIGNKRKLFSNILSKDSQLLKNLDDFEIKFIELQSYLLNIRNGTRVKN